MDVPAFMLANRAGVKQVMDMKGDQAKDFADQLDEVRRREIIPDAPVGAAILTLYSRHWTKLASVNIKGRYT